MSTDNSPVQSEQDLEKLENKNDFGDANQGDSKDVNVLTNSKESKTDYMNSKELSEAQTNDQIVDLDIEVKYNREVLGAETYTSLDDLLLSNKDTLNETETDIIPERVKPVEVNIVKIEYTNVTALQSFSGNESVASDKTESVKENTTNGDKDQDSSQSENGLNEKLVMLSQDSQDNLKMPETRQETEGSVSPSLMAAMCRYRWEKTIVTQSESVVFVTLNNKVCTRVYLSVIVN